MTAYYNENDPHAAAWLRELIRRELIAPGDVDERSILDVRADDLRPYGQCHFFAGIGGWSYALRLAGVSDDRPVWTGSCPCQPFSAAGAQRGSDDERHLWPAFFGLIRECLPATVIGEQVAGAAGLAWLDHVCADLEGAGYAAAAANLGAHSAGAPHLRQRLYWVAKRTRAAWEPCECCDEFVCNIHGMHAFECECPAIDEWRTDPYAYGWLGDAGSAGLQARERAELSGAQRHEEGRAAEQPGCAWSDLEWLACSDGKVRPTQPGICPLAHGVSQSVVRSGDSGAPLDADATGEARVMRLRGYGNAIVPQVAAMFVRASMEASA